MMATTSAVASLPKLPPVTRGGNCIKGNVVPTSNFPIGLVAAPTSKFPRLVLTPKFPRGITAIDGSLPFSCRRTRSQPATELCVEALMENATCHASQTQTTTREALKITHLPGKEKSPQLDVGGSGFPPRDDGGKGGGGGGGGNWFGGFYFFGLLAFLGWLKDKVESEDDDYAYSDNRRRRR